MLNKPLRHFAIATALALPIIALNASMTRAQLFNLNIGSGGSRNNEASTNNKQLLIQSGLQPTDCVPGNIVLVYMPDGKQACAFASAAYAAGTYRMNPNDFSINPIGRAAVNTNVSPLQQQQFQQPQFQPQTQFQQPQFQQPQFQQPQVPVPQIVAPPSGAAFSTVFLNYNPSQPVSPDVTAKINAALSSQGLALAACNVSPLAVFNVNGQYTACAFPNSAYPPGNYRLNLSSF